MARQKTKNKNTKKKGSLWRLSCESAEKKNKMAKNEEKSKKTLETQ